MMNRVLKIFLLIVGFFFSLSVGYSQTGLQVNQVTILKAPKINQPTNFDNTPTELNFFTSVKPFLANPLPPNYVPNIFSANDLAFFCRIELKIEKTAKLPIKFRLGEVQQVEALEQKHPSSRLGY